MATDPALTPLNPDQLLAKLIEMEGVIERQKATLNALDDERNGLKNERDHFKGAFEEADAERQRQRVARMHKIVTDEIQPKQCVSLQMILRRSLDWAKC